MSIRVTVTAGGEPEEPGPSEDCRTSRVANHQYVVAPATSDIDTDSFGTAVETERATVGAGGKNGNPAYSNKQLPAPTGWKLVRSIMASAQPSSPELNSCWVG